MLEPSESFSTAGSSTSKRKLDNDSTQTTTSRKRQKVSNGGEAEFKYITLADNEKETETDSDTNSDDTESQRAHLDLSRSQSPDLSDAFSYLDHVKKIFLSRPDYYKTFVDILKDFSATVIDTPGLIARVTELFTRSDVAKDDMLTLIGGFKKFLPPGYEIDTAGRRSSTSSGTVTDLKDTLDRVENE